MGMKTRKKICLQKQTLTLSEMGFLINGKEKLEEHLFSKITTKNVMHVLYKDILQHKAPIFFKRYLFAMRFLTILCSVFAFVNPPFSWASEQDGDRAVLLDIENEIQDLKAKLILDETRIEQDERRIQQLESENYEIKRDRSRKKILKAS